MSSTGTPATDMSFTSSVRDSIAIASDMDIIAVSTSNTARERSLSRRRSHSHSGSSPLENSTVNARTLE